LTYVPKNLIGDPELVRAAHIVKKSDST